MEVSVHSRAGCLVKRARQPGNAGTLAVVNVEGGIPHDDAVFPRLAEAGTTTD